MYISKIKLTNFKNFSEQDFSLIDGFNFIIGGNGQGKTNVLDAIYTSSFAKSYFLIPDADLVKYENSFYRIEGQLFTKNKKIDFSTSYLKGKKKKIEFEGQNIVKYSKHMGNIVTVMIAPDEQKIVQGSSEERRKLIDHTISQIDATYLEKIIQYQLVLEQRNALLKKISSMEPQVSNDLIEVYNKQMSEYAGFIYQKRVQFFNEIIEYFAHYYTIISDTKEVVTFSYESDLEKDLLYDLLVKTYEKDKILEYTSKGIHRDDFKIIIDHNPLKKFASQGQQKTFIIALKLAICKYLFLRKEDKIILLFDDLFDKLDEVRCERLILLLLNKDFFTQVLFTDTSKSRIENILTKTEAHKHVKIKIFTINQLSVKEYEYN